MAGWTELYVGSRRAPFSPDLWAVPCSLTATPRWTDSTACVNVNSHNAADVMFVRMMIPQPACCLAVLTAVGLLGLLLIAGRRSNPRAGARFHQLPPAARSWRRHRPGPPPGRFTAGSPPFCSSVWAIRIAPW